ncbi:MAG: nickel insertion protein, partial [Roseiflexaceae bacterium]
TFGMRRQLVERYVAERAQCTVATPFGDIRVKRKYWQGSVLHNAPEYEDCAAAARQHGVPIHDVYAAALAAVPAI